MERIGQDGLFIAEGVLKSEGGVEEGPSKIARASRAAAEEARFSIEFTLRERTVLSTWPRSV